MKELISYGLLIFGAPVMIGGLIGMVFMALPDPISEVLNGALSTLVAISMFKLFGVEVTLLVPLFVAIISSVWLAKRKEVKSIPWQVLGVAIVGGAYFMIISQP